jgi:hypothetical protein
MKCNKCQQDKKLDEMKRDRSLTNGVAGRCKDCSAQASRAWYQANLDQARESARHRRSLAPDKFRMAAGLSNQRLREKVVTLLGSRCSKCGLTDKRVLQVDHIFGGGNDERKRLGPRGTYHRVLETSGEGYQLLCANCNWIKRHENKEWMPS